MTCATVARGVLILVAASALVQSPPELGNVGWVGFAFSLLPAAISAARRAEESRTQETLPTRPKGHARAEVTS